jgi:hypothetical protein
VTQFRKTFVLSAAARNAWIAVAADEGFEVVVNGASVGRSLIWRTTHPFQSGLSEHGQTVGVPDPTIDLNFPREYQWRGHRSYLIPTFFDLAPFLGRGENTLCIEVESRVSARLAVEGEVLLWSGERVRLDSDEGFKAAVRPPEDGRRWTEATYSDLGWPHAIRSEPPEGRLQRILDPDVFREPFAGEWLRAPQPFQGATWFETGWELDSTPRDAWVRVLADRPYVLFVNDVPVRALIGRASDSDSGEWSVGLPKLADKAATPELLNGDEVRALFAGSRFEPTAQSDALAVLLEAPRGAPGDVYQPPMSQDLGSARAAPEPADPLARSPELAAPLARPPPAGVLNGYGISPLLRKGRNTLSVRIAAPDPAATASLWPVRVAVDGRATGSGGSQNRLGSGGSWMARTQASDGALSAAIQALSSGSVDAPDVHLPRLQYRGNAEPIDDFLLRVMGSSRAVVLALVLLGNLPRGVRWLVARSGRQPVESDAERREWTQIWMLLVPCTALFALFLVYLSWRERDDSLLLLHASLWRVAVAGALFLAAGVVLAREIRWPPLRAPGDLLRALPSRRAWPVLLVLVLLLCAFLRAHKIASQPWEDDELSSAQAGLAIADTGLPRYADDIYYTRSPLYHYVVGASVRLLGHDIWGLRLPSVLFATATALLLYVAGARLLESRWTGLVAAALYAVHPYAIFVGHFVRFYQQQQFFCLSTIYFFCQGFVTGQRQRARFLALGSFLAACLSQELSVVMAAPLLVGYLLFARATNLRSTVCLGVAAGCVGTLVALDVAVFLTACQTRLDGISPNVEATLAFHFENPLNLLTMFLSYSRLHLALSALLFLSLPLLLMGKNRNALALLVVLFGGVVATNLLVTLEALRYLYWLLPVWLLLGVYGLRALVRAAASLGDGDSSLTRHWLAPGAGLTLVAAVVASWSPWKMAGSYDTTIVGDSTSALSYVRGELREGDAVAATEPQPPAALLEVGRIDYDVSVPLLHDFVYRKDGKLVDRNGGSQVISTIEQLEDAIARKDRLWMVVDRMKFRSRGQDILWGYPAARFEAFLRENFELKHESFQYAVFLWDAHSGRYHSFREHGTPPL